MRALSIFGFWLSSLTFLGSYSATIASYLISSGGVGVCGFFDLAASTILATLATFD